MESDLPKIICSKKFKYGKNKVNWWWNFSISQIKRKWKEVDLNSHIGCRGWNCLGHFIFIAVAKPLLINTHRLEGCDVWLACRHLLRFYTFDVKLSIPPCGALVLLHSTCIATFEAKTHIRGECRGTKKSCTFSFLFPLHKTSFSSSVPPLRCRIWSFVYCVNSFPYSTP